jgi:hypothetical protein
MILLSHVYKGLHTATRIAFWAALLLGSCCFPAAVMDRLESKGWLQVSQGKGKRKNIPDRWDKLNKGCKGGKYRLEELKDIPTWPEQPKGRSKAREVRAAMQGLQYYIKDFELYSEDDEKQWEDFKWKRAMLWLAFIKTLLLAAE